VTTAVGYAGGFTPNANYREVCTGQTGHAEAVLVAYDPKRISFEELLRVFWENHDPTQAMRQGNDVGTQYRSLIQVSDDEERRIAEASRDAYQEMLTKAGYGQVMTEITERTPFYYAEEYKQQARTGDPRKTFYFAEEYHQQYLDKVPNGYCPNHSTGVKLPDDFAVTPLQYID
jgi:peptide-methionine (S)-S-oxide reductase